MSGQTVYRFWLVDGRISEHQEPGVSATGRSVSVSTGQPLVVELTTQRLPVRVQLLVYRTLGPNGLPDGKIQDAMCVLEPETGPCTYRVDDEVVVRTTLEAGARVVVLNAGWYVPSGMRERHPESPSEVSAAWAFLVEPQQTPMTEESFVE